VSGFVLDWVAFILTEIFHDHYRELVALIFISGNPGLETGCKALFFSVFHQIQAYSGRTGNVFLFGGEGDFPGSEFYLPTIRNTLFRLIGGVSRKNKWDEIVGVFIREKVWLENSVRRSESQ
jgi:hypothetical protein